MSGISKKELEHLAELARIKIASGEEEKLIADLKKILDHFEELKELPEAPAISAGTELQSVFREDGERESSDQGSGLESFPEERDGFLKVPPVFER